MSAQVLNVAAKLNYLLDENRELPDGEFIRMSESDLMQLCDQTIEILKRDSPLLRIPAPLNVCGDLHGQYTDLVKFLDLGGSPEDSIYLFMGDYVDRGNNSVETLTKLLCLKNLYPDHIYLLRGNHETPEISELYGFLEECEERYSIELWKKFNTLFEYLPLAAIISDRIFCVHGGLSQDLTKLSQIEDLTPPITVPESGLILDLLWADPNPDSHGYTPSERGTSYTFGEDVAEQFLSDNDFDLICRAHQVVMDGFEFPFYPNQTVVTVFSAPDYCREFGNKGAMLKIDENLTCSFQFVEPENTTTSMRPPTPGC